MSNEEGPTEENVQALTPTLNNLLNKSSEGSNTQQDVNGTDKYAATAAAVAAGAGSVPDRRGHAQASSSGSSLNANPAQPSHTPGVPDWTNSKAANGPEGVPPLQGGQNLGIATQGVSPGYSHHYMSSRPPFPAYSNYPSQPGYPPGYPNALGPQMMRPHIPTGQDLVRMPPGPTPTEWAAQHQKIKDPNGNQETSSNALAPSPGSSSVAEESLDDKSVLESTSFPNHQRSVMPGIQSQMQFAQNTGSIGPSSGTNVASATASAQNARQSLAAKAEIVEKLVGPVNKLNPMDVMVQRRAFFERLVNFCDQHGDPITMVPQVSKQNIDLHRLYIAVRNRGGFQQVTKDKAWKSICTEASPELSESSAAGYQLRKHYQKHLLLLECLETGRNPDDEVAFAEKLKRQRRKEGVPGAPAVGQPFPGNTGASGPTSGFPGSVGDPNYYYQPHGIPHPGHPGYPPPHPGFSPGQFPPRMSGLPGPTTMRGPMSQHMMPHDQIEEQRQQWLAHQAQAHAQHQIISHNNNAQPGTPGSIQPSTPAALQVDTSAGSQAGSRAPSVGPTQPNTAATPDSSSRLSAGTDSATATDFATRPGSASVASATPASSAHPVAPSSVTPAPSAPSTSMANTTSTSSAGSFYPGQPGPMYSNGPMRHGGPGFAPAPGGSQSQNYGYPPGAPPQSGYHPAAHPSHPHHQQYMMWQQQQRNYPQGVGSSVVVSGGQSPAQNQLPPNNRYMYSQRVPTQPGAPSPGGQKARYQAAPGVQPPYSNVSQRSGAPTAPAASVNIVPTPAALQQGQSQTTYPPPSNVSNCLASVQTGSVQGTQAQSVSITSSLSTSQPFPQGSTESTTISQKRRRKILARELINATPRRLIMALRSGLETEAVWAMNSLNVLLYDDSNPTPTLQQMPGLLNVIVEHLWASLSVLYPNHFELGEPGKSSVNVLNRENELTVKDILNSTDCCSAKMPVLLKKSGDFKNKPSVAARTGGRVQLKDIPLPIELKMRLLRENVSSEDYDDETLTQAFICARGSLGLGGGLAERVAIRLHAKLSTEKRLSSSRFSKFKNTEQASVDVKSDMNIVMDDESKVPNGAPSTDLSDGKHEHELLWPRPSALCPQSPALCEIAQRTLSLSNILRGFSFVPGSELLMGKHEALLFALGRFLNLYADEVPIKPNKRKSNPDPTVLPSESLEEQHAKSIAVLDEDDSQRALLVETAHKLRDDAFVMLTHMSATLDLFELASEIAFPIYDGLLHWCVSSVPEATDVLGSSAISPRNYALEAICKMSVVERNVDMLLSTGAWIRIEKLVHILSKLLIMSEETHYREFAIVILNAMCFASEAVCYVAAIETSAISTLIQFIDSADQNMHQVMQSHGMSALRDNPEMMGTSVGMLRRAASMLRVLIKVPGAHKHYAKHQCRLLQFTMSQLMDSRVAGMIADTLFEMQELVRKFGGEYLDQKNEDSDDKLIAIEKETIENGGELSCSSTASEPKIHGNRTTSHSSFVNGNEYNNDGDFTLPTERNIKRSSTNQLSNSPPSKRSCLENGFDAKQNGNMTPENAATAHDNGTMTAVA